MESADQGNIYTSAHDWGQVLRFQGKSGSHFGSFTSHQFALFGKMVHELMSIISQSSSYLIER